MPPVRQHTEFASGILNAMSSHIAVVDRSGEIVTVNQAWRDFARRNGHPASARTGAGANYLEVCRKAEAAGDASATAIRLGIESVLWGEQSDFSCEYPCHSPQVQRWFLMRVTHMQETHFAVIAHEDITARRLAEEKLRASHRDLELRVERRTAELEQRNLQLHEEVAQRERSRQQLLQAAKVFDNAIEAIVVADAERHIVRVNAAFTRITGYEPGEVAGKNPRLLRSGRHDEAFHAAVWQSLEDSGQWQGEIWNRRKNGEIYPAWESISVTKGVRGQVLEYVSVFSDISVVKQAEERLAHLAHHDALTGLCNRLLFFARLDQALVRARRRQGMLALLFIDLDEFKSINDSLGHDVGDRYLVMMASRLSALVRAEDTVARLGGDEFAILAEDLGSAPDAGRLAEKVVRALAQAACIDGHVVSSSGSIGIGIYPDDATDGESLLKAADAAMYLAKAQGRNTARFYRPELSAQALERAAWKDDLRRALADEQLLLHYQPVVDLETMRCVGLEALLRWQSPERGLVMPESFIALAEETRWIQPIGQWMLRRIFLDQNLWRARGMAPLRVSVNLPWRQVNDEHFIDQFDAAVDAAEGDRNAVALDLEIAENTLQCGTQAVDALFRLRERGVRILVDDFGTGSSSLSQLIKRPVDGLKIDRTITTQVGRHGRSRAVFRAIVALARGLELDLVADGVENEAQLAFLRAEGCRFAQGVLLGAPVPADEVPGLPATRRAAEGLLMPASD